MTKQEMEQYRDKKPISVYPMGNWGGIEILDILYGIDDYIIWRYNWGEPEDIIHKAKIRSNPIGYNYITINGTKIKLDECMKV